MKNSKCYLSIQISIGLVFLFTFCKTKTDISNSVWQFNWIESNEKDEFKFTNFEYVEYSAEVGEHYYGTYQVKGDTIFLHQDRGEYDREFPEDSHHRTEKKVYKLLLVNNTQLGYVDLWKDDKWEDDYYFTKVE